MDFGSWGEMVRELADYDVSQYGKILRWPLAEALESLVERMRDDALRAYELACQVWSTLAATGASSKRKPPPLPAILED